MATSVEELCQLLASAFSEGRLDGLSEHYLYPLAIYTPGGVRIEISPEETAEAVFARRALALKAGMKSVRVTVFGVDEMQGGRIPVDLEWTFLDGGGNTVGRSILRYFCRRGPDGRLRIEMIEFFVLAFADAIRTMPGPARTS